MIYADGPLCFFHWDPRLQGFSEICVLPPWWPHEMPRFSFSRIWFKKPILPIFPGNPQLGKLSQYLWPSQKRYMAVSKNRRFSPKSFIKKIGFSNIFTIHFWGKIPLCLETPIYFSTTPDPLKFADGWIFPVAPFSMSNSHLCHQHRLAKDATQMPKRTSLYKIPSKFLKEAWVLVYAYVCMYVCMYVYVYIYMCVCIATIYVIYVLYQCSALVRE